MTLALLFDIDGTMVETDPLHFAAFNAVLEGVRPPITLADYQRHVMGSPDAAILDFLFPAPAPRPADLIARKEVLFRAMATRMAPVAGLIRLLDWAQAGGVAVAAVTNAPRANADLMLAGIGVAARFPVLVIGAELARPKPDPMPYQTAMQHLGVAPDACIAFEDSRAGLASASASGAEVVGMASALSPDALRAAGAAHVIADFNDPGLWHLLARRVAPTKRDP